MYARWSAYPDRPPAIDYVVHHAGGSTPVTVDQRFSGGRWYSLGEFDLAPGQNHRVSLSAVVGERTVADGVRFVPIADARMVQADSVKIVPNTAEDALYVHTDQLGTPRKLTDPTGAVVWDASLTPYGLEDSIAGTETLDSRFPGQWADAESGLNYNYFRDYDPTLGRYIQSDPIGLRGGLNTYAYVGGNPLSRFDLFGLDSYLVSRRSITNRTSHNFVATDAQYPGDPNATVHSFGENAAGNVGNVGPGTTPSYWSATTHQTDVDFWLSLASGDQCIAYANPSVSAIPATDATVNDLASRLIEDQDYAAFAGPFGANSNSAAQAIADTAAGAPVPIPDGPRISPGAGSADEIGFR